MGQIIPLFSTPVYQSNIYLDNYTVGTLSNVSFNQRNRCSISENKKILDLDFCKNLKQALEEEANEYIYQQLEIDDRYRFKFTDSWIMKHVTNDFSPKHWHWNSVISGILYLDVYPDSGKLLLTNDNYNHLFKQTIGLKPKYYNIFNSQVWEISPQNGDLIMFPSFLSHAVTHNQNTRDRYCLAFNMFIDGELEPGIN